MLQDHRCGQGSLRSGSLSYSVSPQPSPFYVMRPTTPGTAAVPVSSRHFTLSAPNLTLNVLQSFGPDSDLGLGPGTNVINIAADPDAPPQYRGLRPSCPTSAGASRNLSFEHSTFGHLPRASVTTPAGADGGASNFCIGPAELPVGPPKPRFPKIGMRASYLCSSAGVTPSVCQSKLNGSARARMGSWCSWPGTAGKFKELSCQASPSRFDTDKSGRQRPRPGATWRGAHAPQTQSEAYCKTRSAGGSPVQFVAPGVPGGHRSRDDRSLFARP